VEIYIISRQMTSFVIHSYGEHKLWSAPLGGTISILQPLGRGKGGRKEEKKKRRKRMRERCAWTRNACHGPAGRPVLCLPSPNALSVTSDYTQLCVLDTLLGTMQSMLFDAFMHGSLGVKRKTVYYSFQAQ